MTKTKNPRRRDEQFDWFAGCGMPAYATLANVPFHLLFRDAEAVATAYREGLPRARELFGPDVSYGGPACIAISYGHVNALGAPLVFPEDSEVSTSPIYGSLAEGIEALSKETDFLAAGEMPFYLEFRERLQAMFPEHRIPLPCKSEGPVTTAWLLRGHDFFADLVEYPRESAEFLRLVCRSVVAFQRMLRRLSGAPPIGDSAGVCDDIAAMLSPSHWPEFVMPVLEEYYRGLTTGRRGAHIEGLRSEHLKYLDELGLDSFDPSVSPALTPAAVRDGCTVSFSWRLNSMQYAERGPAEIERWVYESAAGGPSGVYTIADRELCNAADAEKVKAFIRAAKDVQRRVAEGSTRERLRGIRPPQPA